MNCIQAASILRKRAAATISADCLNVAIILTAQAEILEAFGDQEVPEALVDSFDLHEAKRDL